MNTRSTWTLVLVALGMFAFIFFFERNLRLTPEPPGPLLPSLSLSAVTAVQVRPGDQDVIRVERTNGSWQLTRPLPYPAQSQFVDALLLGLHSLSRQRQISSDQLQDHKQPLEEYGFTKPQFTLTLEQGERELKLLVGHTTRTGDEVFLQVIGSEGFFLCNAALLKVLPRTADDWRERLVVKARASDIDRLMVTNGTYNLEFLRDPTNKIWRLGGLLPARADSPRIDQFLQKTLDLSITQFVPHDSNADLAAYGLRPAVLDLALRQGTNPPVLLSFGNSPPNDTNLVYLRRRDLPGVALVERDKIEAWLLPQEQFRDRQLLPLAEGVVDRVEVKGEGAFTLELQSNAVWRVTAPEPLPADPELVREFFGFLSGLRIAKFVREVVNPGDPPRYGLQEPARSFLLTAAATNAPGGRRTVAQLDFGSVTDDREMIHVRRTDEQPIYAISRKQNDELPDAGWRLRDRRIWNFTTNEVARVVVRHDGQVLEVVRDAAGQWTPGPATTGPTSQFNHLFANYTIESLGQVKAHDFWVDHGPEAPVLYGITDRTLSIEVELRGENPPRKLRVDIGKLAKNNFPYAATTLDGQTWIFEFPFGTYIQVLNSLDPKATRQ